MKKNRTLWMQHKKESPGVVSSPQGEANIHRDVPFPPISAANNHTFILRLWCDPCQENQGAPFWRGVIESVNNNQRLYFIDSDGIFRFIEEQSRIQIRTRVPWWRALFSWLAHAR